MVKIFKAFIVIFCLFLLSLTTSHAQDGYFSSAMDCPLESKIGRRIVYFGDRKLRSDKSDRYILGPISANIPAGKYKITLVSNDPSHPQMETQPEEQWFLKLSNQSNNEVKTKPISDLADSEVTKIEEVEANMEIPFDITAATAIHPAYYSTNPNSIVPVCAALDEILEVPPSPTPSPTPQPNSSCSLDLVPNPLQLQMGSFNYLYANVLNQQNGAVTSVTFTSSDTSIAQVSGIDSNPPFRTTISAGRAGTAQVTATGLMNGVATCTATSEVLVGATKPWWQVYRGDVIAGGKLISEISPYCEEPTCFPYFNLGRSLSSAGVVVYGGTEYDFSNNPLSLGDVSLEGWLANTSSLAKKYDYDYVLSLVPSGATANEVSGIINNAGMQNGTLWRDYYLYKSTGSLTTNGNITIPANRKVILLVDGDLTIRGRINLAAGGKNFFMAVAKGNINIDPSVTGSNNPALEGLFVTTGHFNSGASDKPLWVRGSVVAYSGFNLGRDLGVANNTNPAEIFDYNPSLSLFFPSFLAQQTVIWKEVAP